MIRLRLQVTFVSFLDFTILWWKSSRTVSRLLWLVSHLRTCRSSSLYRCRLTQIWKIPILARCTFRTFRTNVIHRQSTRIRYRIITNPGNFLEIFLLIIKLNSCTSNIFQAILYHQRKSIISLPEKWASLIIYWFQLV